MSNSEMKLLVKENMINTKDFLNFLKESTNENYEDFIMNKIVEIFEDLKLQIGDVFKKTANIEFEINNYDVSNNTLECLYGPQKIIWTVESFEDDMMEVLYKLNLLRIESIDLRMFYEIIKFLLLEKILLFEEDGFNQMTQEIKDLYYFVLVEGVYNSKIKINKIRKKIKRYNKKIIKKIEKLFIIESEMILKNMSIILESKYKGLSYKKFICCLFPELYFESREYIRSLVEEIENGKNDKQENDKEEYMYEETQEVALFKIDSWIKKYKIFKK